jgi:hypothetical protein
MRNVLIIGILSAVVLVTNAAASESLKAVVQSYVEIQAQLAADKIDGIKAPAANIAKHAATMKNEALVKSANALEKATDIKAAREAFGTMSDALMEAGKKENWKDVDGVRLAFCPMANHSWLQKEEQIRNPFYGSKMLTCGEFKPLK